MPRFTVRIELHEASWDQYEELHKNMSLQGFTDTIETQKSTVQMPPAEYNFDGALTKEQVLDKAKIAAVSIVKKYAVLVTESNGRTWYGLDNA